MFSGKSRSVPFTPLSGRWRGAIASLAGVQHAPGPRRTSCLQDAFLRRLSQENPVRNHLDMRHRLDKDGKRYGKVIDYRCGVCSHA